MSHLRTHLSSLHRHYHAAYYPGDLAAELHGRRSSAPRWVRTLGVFGGAIAAGVALFFMLDTPQVLPWETPASASPGASVSVPLTLPTQSGEFDMAVPFQTFGLPTPADEAVPQSSPSISTSQESA